MMKCILCTVAAVCLGSALAFGDSDGKITCTPPSPRFILSEGEAFDQATQLIWCRCSLGTTWIKGSGCMGTPRLMSLEDARRSVKKTGGGWRIPTIQELTGIVKQDGTGPAIDTDVFPDVISLGEEAPYWTGSRVEELPRLVYCIDFRNGIVDGHSEGFPMAVRLVRTAP